jgi:methylglutaconyl-CoA hydratase
VTEVLFERDGPVARLTLNRPEIRNAIGPSLIAQLTALFGALRVDDTRVVVLTGAGGSFCAGADIEWMRASRELAVDANVADAAATRTMFEAIDACPKPVVAGVNGHAMGGGVGLVACADIAVAVDGARFGFTETRLGIIPALISPYVLRRIGPGHTRALFTSARVFDAAEAHRVGLVHRVVADAGLDAAVGEAVDDLLACGPAAIAETKRLIRDATASFALDDLPQRIAAVRSSPEGQEGLAAFIEKRKPGWAGNRSAES